MPRKPVCPLCRKPTNPEFAPFCGRGCRDRDLIGWLDESYRVPAGGADTDEEDSARSAYDEDA